jgi:hypothetical protein
LANSENSFSKNALAAKRNSKLKKMPKSTLKSNGELAASRLPILVILRVQVAKLLLLGRLPAVRTAQTRFQKFPIKAIRFLNFH